MCKYIYIKQTNIQRERKGKRGEKEERKERERGRESRTIHPSKIIIWNMYTSQLTT